MEPPQQPTTSQPHNNEDESRNSDDLTREQLIERRASRLSQLTKCYKDHYWLLMEDVRRKHREFIWKYGNDTAIDSQNSVVFANNNNKNGEKLGLGLGLEDDLLNRCSNSTCNFKAMALTKYCNVHILSDSNQVLYMGCQFAHRCGEEPLLCGKPVLRSSVPPMCPNHMRLSETNIRKALKKNGASVSATTKLGSKFHLVLTEYVHLIQSQRRARAVDNGARHNK